MKKKLSNFRLDFEELPFKISRPRPTWAKEKRWLKWTGQAVKNDSISIYKWTAKQFRGFTKKTKTWYSSHKPKHLKITIHLTWTRIIILFVLGWAVWPHSGQTIAIDIPHEGGATVPTIHVEQLKPIAKAHFKPLPLAKPVEVQPTPTYTASAVSQNASSCGSNWAQQQIYQHESGCRLVNPNGGGCDGIGQACPVSKLIAVCPDWQTNWDCQNRFFTNYMLQTYGSWENAWAKWQSRCGSPQGCWW